MNITDIQTLAAKAHTNAQMAVRYDFDIALEEAEKILGEKIDHRANRKAAKALIQDAEKDHPEVKQDPSELPLYYALSANITATQIAEVLRSAGREDLLAPLAAVYTF